MSIKPKEAKRICIAYEALFQETSSILFYSKAELDKRLSLLQSNFPKGSLHAIAIKTCNHPDILKHIVDYGFGLEAASIEEVHMAINAGCPFERIVFDSPVKTRSEINECHEHYPGITLNANSLQELERYPLDFNGTLGLRINPLVTNEAQALLNVSGTKSKFGVPISEEKQIIQALLLHSTISCIHIHIGSQIADFSQNLCAIEKTMKLIRKINKARIEEGLTQEIKTIDIGGGIDFDLNPDAAFHISKFTAKLQKIIPSDFSVITEYGHFIHYQSAFVASKVEYVIERKEMPDAAYIHVGADLFVRKVYSKLNIDYPLSVIQQHQASSSKSYDIYGPLCFAGDQLFENIALPKLSEGDIICIHDTGANTLSMWSGHCGRVKPKFILY